MKPTLSLRRLQRRAVRISVGVAGQNRVEFQGVMREPDAVSWLVPFIDEIHGEAVSFELPEVTLDVRRLEYANAAVWKCFVYWVRKVREDVRSKYLLHVIAGKNVRWQEIGMRMLRVFGSSRLVVTEEEVPDSPGD